LAVGAASAAIVGLAIILAMRYAGPDRLARTFPASQEHSAIFSSEAPGGPVAPLGRNSDPGLRSLMSYSADPKTISGPLLVPGAYTAGNSPGAYVDPADLGYFEYAIPGSGDRRLIMRLPKAIREQYGQTSEDYFIRHVSHRDPIMFRHVYQQVIFLTFAMALTVAALPLPSYALAQEGRLWLIVFSCRSSAGTVCKITARGASAGRAGTPESGDPGSAAACQGSGLSRR
jgi:hypothetical protein